MCVIRVQLAAAWTHMLTYFLSSCFELSGVDLFSDRRRCKDWQEVSSVCTERKKRRLLCSSSTLNCFKPSLIGTQAFCSILQSSTMVQFDILEHCVSYGTVIGANECWVFTVYVGTIDFSPIFLFKPHFQYIASFSLSFEHIFESVLALCRLGWHCLPEIIVLTS